jgi:signal transduction histidine kinase/CheY-like chemotaxis protein
VHCSTVPFALAGNSRLRDGVRVRPQAESRKPPACAYNPSVDQPPETSRLTRAEAFGRLFEAVHEGVYIGVLSPVGDTTLAANPYLRLIFGYPGDTPEEDLRPFDPTRFTDPSARGLFVDRLAREGSVTDYLLRLRRVDGSAIWAEVTAHASRGRDNEVTIDALVRDVSDRKKLEDQARDLYSQLLQAEKMAALGQTISGVAHELNNPLATILTWAERLSGRDTDPNSRRGLEAILGEAERAARIVRNLLTFARKRHTTRTMVDVNQVVRETLALRAYEQRVTNISVIDALAAGLPHIFADSHQIQQVLLNLIINAEQAMLTANGRGLIVVRTWQELERESVILEVNDDGPGVPDEVKSKIFDPFFTTKEVGKGTGLGLTVAYAIVQEHGGRLWVESAMGRGASFFVELPATRGRLRAVPAAAAPPETGPRLDGRAILIVEDEAQLASAMAEAFTDAGFLVDRAGDGEEALERVQEGQYDLIVCDLKMPRMDGMQFYGILTEQVPAMAERVLFVTGDVIGTDAERFLSETGCRWLAKPFRLGDLLRAAKEVVGG